MSLLPVSEAPKEAPKAAKYSSREILTAKSDEEKKSEVWFPLLINNNNNFPIALRFTVLVWMRSHDLLFKEQ